MADEMYEGCLTIPLPADIRPYLEKLNGGAASQRELRDFVAWLAYSAAAYSLLARMDSDIYGACLLARAAERAAVRWKDTAPANDEE